MLGAPPTDGTPWRPAPIPVPDRVVLQGNSEAFEAADALGTTAWHARGWDGTGVKVAVFDVQWEQLEQPVHTLELGAFTTHDCWAHKSCDPAMDSRRTRFGFERGAHGTACAEVIRDLAPGVELHLVRVNALTTFENALSWAARNDIDIISMSLSFFNESIYDGSGSVNDAMDRLADSDTLLVTSAGNYAQEHWRESFLDTDGDGWHEFEGGSELLEVRYAPGSGRATLLWNDFDNCGDTDLDFYAVDGDGRVLGRAGARQVAGADDCAPIERLGLTAPRDRPVFLKVHHAGGSPNTIIDIMARGADMVIPHPWGSVTDPGTHPAAFTVGAVRATADYARLGPESFSSWGPTGSGLAKPDIAGPDGLSSSVYGVTGFYGTSASTPAVAAAIALVMSRYPDLGPREAAGWLADQAMTEQDAGEAPDPALGAGRARLPPPDAGSAGCGSRFAAAPLGLMLLSLGLRRRRPA